MLAAYVFAQVLTETVKAAGGVESSIQMIFKQKVYRANVGELASVNLPANVILAQQLPEFGGAQHRSEPVPFVVVTNKEAEIAIRALVARSAEYNMAKWCTSGRTETGEVYRARGVITWLLSLIGLDICRRRNVNYGSVR